LLLSVFGLAGIPLTLRMNDISWNQYIENPAWYAGFKDSATRWPFVAYASDSYAGDSTFECATIRCPVEKMTQISRSFYGHPHPISGRPLNLKILDSQGLIVKGYGGDLEHWQKELISTFYDNLIDCSFNRSSDNCEGMNPTSQFRPLGNGNIYYSESDFLRDSGVRIQRFYIDTRASSTLFFLDWSAAIGMLGSVVCLLFLRRVRGYER
jgi:hypothetical protein